jgi:leucyl aminopeptidase
MSNVKTAAIFAGINTQPDALDVDLVVVPVFTGDERDAALDGVDRASGGAWRHAVASGELRCRFAESLVIPVQDRSWKARRIAIVCAGERHELNADRARRVAATAGYLARQSAVASVAFVARPGFDAAVAADGLSAAEFDGGTYKSADKRPAAFPTRVEVTVPGGDAAAVAGLVARGRVIGESANFTRSLANEPGNVLTPREFAARVTAEASAVGLRVEVLDEKQMRELGMGLLLGVAQGSAEPPRLIVLRYDPPGATGPMLGLIGKGVTFDSGGISIKPADGMERMKDDMAGGAAVAGALRAIAVLGGKHRVIGVIPTVENMPGGRAIRPGDVIMGASGTSVEIINTDAEGRLILADALWFARKEGATHLVDVATLTGACMVALGRTVSGLFGNSDEWVDVVHRTSEQAGDRLWPMPIYEETADQLKSDIADLINSAGRAGGAITAAAFLSEFAGDGPWAHLDIAGTAWAEEKQPYQPKGATGVAVRTLIALGLSGGRPASAPRD